MPKGINRLLSQLRTEDWISPALDAAVKTEPAGWNGKTAIHIKPSSAGDSCPRSVQLGMLGHVTGFAAKNRRRMDNGSDAHERIEGEYTAAGLVHRLELKFTLFSDGTAFAGNYWDAPKPGPGRELMYRGAVDVVAVRPDDATPGMVYLGDIKTTNSWRFGRVPPAVADRGEMARHLWRFDAGAVRQCITYREMLRGYREALGLPEIADDLFIHYENTDNQDDRVVWFTPSAKMVEEALAGPLQARQACLDGELIEPPFEQNSTVCRRCYRESVCYDLQMEDEDSCKAVAKALTQTRVSP